MGKNIFVPPFPHIDPPSQETIDKLKNMTKKDHREFNKSEAYQKYVLPVLKRDRKKRKTNNIKWWKNNWINIAGLILALIGIMLTIIFSA